MPLFKAPLDDLRFVLHDVLKVSEQDIPGYSDLDEELTSAILDEAGKLANDVFAPLNQVGDREGCKLENGIVITPTGFKEAYQKFCENGWSALDLPEEYGGQNIPTVVTLATNELFVSANQALCMYTGLTHGAWMAIHSHASEELKETYLHKMTTGEWSGTMNLTEPHCGTDLGLMRTKAVPSNDGSYKLSGSKIFISSGDHELAENIIHLVLAKIQGAPEGIKGVSLFIVPKYLVNKDGTLGARNGVSVGSLEHKMGIHGNATCVLNYDDAEGYLVGEPNKGMQAMFTMMNEARIGTGMQGYCIAASAYANAVEYAKDRLQGRDVKSVNNTEGPADPIIVHPDIRRTLMDQKSYIEGARLFSLWLATLVDKSERAKDEQAADMLALLTPVIKAFVTDKGYEAATNAQQVLGGHGYIEEWGMSQFVRDVRISQIYEGANGVQALDLVGRKLGAKGGKPVMAFGMMIKEFIDSISSDGSLSYSVGKPLLAALGDFQTGCTYLMQNGAQDPHAALSGSTDFLHLMGHLCFGYVLGMSAKASHEKLGESDMNEEFYCQKINTVQHYLHRQLPMTRMHLKRIQAGPDTVMSPSVESF
ncbi:acyl-CoA dehydrogenase C-terminal domain-containing protein [Glaciecola petra]|uniref:Acyl-CoA dehydrogenase C-terminal domain-containing protein n=1 Tax=Glaciecola petra TaxID=3075602 RepID=A0ABU2ZVQ2_9ALTE|nr:acyl-CoA dehydrogenase C-terminal domain-containing protein [Aestuariibacter sp. P117]MDT0596466.1 acyl-CoA dehydrogenase C-terminal domain-containing protein [Aestuariibacter sp. P117]